MRFVVVLTLCVVLVIAGCASRALMIQQAPSPAAKPTVPIAKNNRFDMNQNGRKMSADDFDAWMKARGIRVAKGKPQAKPRVKAQAQPKAKAQAKPKL